MARPLIAVVGSAEPTRAYDPPLRHPELVAPACADLGRKLAAAGCDLLVYSGLDPGVFAYSTVVGSARSPA